MILADVLEVSMSKADWMVSRILAAILSLGTILATPALADDAEAPKGVIELFMSQGCASCPAADRAMGYLAAQPDVVALAFHVDYWNYRGWTDPLGSAENTARQYGYAHMLGRSGVYTPQAILNGRDQIKGTDAVLLNERLDHMRSSGAGLSVPVHARKHGDELSISIGAGTGKADVVVVYFRSRQDMEITKGTNKGLRVSNWNSVTDVQTVGMWAGEELHLTLPSKIMGQDNNGGCAILLQTTGPNGEPAAILGATILSAAKSS